MPCSRRDFMQSALAASRFGLAVRQALVPIASGATVDGYRASLLPSQKEVWDWQVWMAKLGPKYTGNQAHTEFVGFLATHLKDCGIEVAHERYTLPRWEAKE